MTSELPDEVNVAGPTRCKEDNTAYLWNFRLVHIRHGGLDNIVKSAYGSGNVLNSVQKWDFGEGCDFGKQTRVGSIDKSPDRANLFQEVIHRVVCVPMQNS